MDKNAFFFAFFMGVELSVEWKEGGWLVDFLFLGNLILLLTTVLGAVFVGLNLAEGWDGMESWIKIHSFF